MRLLKFGAKWCGPCKALAKAKTLEKFAAEHPDVEVVAYDVDDDASSALHDDMKLKSVPAFVFVSGETTLAKQEGALDLAGLEKLYAKAKRKL